MKGEGLGMNSLRIYRLLMLCAQRLRLHVVGALEHWLKMLGTVNRRTEGIEERECSIVVIRTLFLLMILANRW